MLPRSDGPATPARTLPLPPTVASEDIAVLVDTTLPPLAALVDCLWAAAAAVPVFDPPLPPPPPDDFSEKGQLDFFALALGVAFFAPLRCCFCPLPGIQEMRERCCCCCCCSVELQPSAVGEQQLPARALDERDRRPAKDSEPNRVDAVEDADFRLLPLLAQHDTEEAQGGMFAVAFDALPTVTVATGELSLAVFAEPVETTLVGVVGAAAVWFEELSSTVTSPGRCSASFAELPLLLLVAATVEPPTVAADGDATADDPAVKGTERESRRERLLDAWQQR